MQNALKSALCAATLALALLPQAARADLSPTGCSFPAEVAKQADAWLAKGYGAGVVMATIDAEGKACYSRHGVLEIGSGKTVDEQTLFEIGSVTKVFTALTLARLSEAGQLGLDDAVQDYLPTAKIPKGSNRVISLKDLATHTSGLPRMPSNFNPSNMGNPYVDYTQGQLWAFLAAYKLERPVGSQYEYSNLGFGLLEQAMTQKTAKPYETLLMEQVIKPLGLRDTAINLARNQLMRFATGHEGQRPVPHWDFQTLAGAGALRSSAADMSSFVAAAMGARKSPLDSSFALSTQTMAPSGLPNLDLGLAWHLLKLPDAKLVMHDGGTGGFKSFVGFDPAKHQGVVVLANSTAFPTGEFALHLLAPQNPLPVLRDEVSLNEAQQNQVVGAYMIDEIGLKVVVTRENGKLMAGFVGQGSVELHPISATKFFLTEVPVEIEFVLDAKGQAIELKMTQNGETVVGKKQAS